MAHISDKSLKKGHSISIQNFMQQHTFHNALLHRKKIADFISRLIIAFFSDFYLPLKH